MLDVELVVRFRLGPHEMPTSVTMLRRVQMQAPPQIGSYVFSGKPFMQFRVDGLSYDVDTHVVTAFHFQAASDADHVGRLTELWGNDGFAAVLGDPA